jgi:hypothetical protein
LHGTSLLSTRAKLNHAPDRLSLRGAGTGPAARAHVHGGKVPGLLFAQYAHGIDDRVHVFEQRHPVLFGSSLLEVHGYESASVPALRGGAAHRAQQRVSLGQLGGDEAAADETACACQQDIHADSPWRRRTFATPLR